MCPCVESWIWKGALYTSSPGVIFTCVELHLRKKLLIQTKLLPCSRFGPSTGLRVGYSLWRKKRCFPQPLSALIIASCVWCSITLFFLSLLFRGPGFMLNRRSRVLTYPSSSLSFLLLSLHLKKKMECWVRNPWFAVWCRSCPRPIVTRTWTERPCLLVAVGSNVFLESRLVPGTCRYCLKAHRSQSCYFSNLFGRSRGLARLTSFQVVPVLQSCRSLLHGNGLDHVLPSFFPPNLEIQKYAVPTQSVSSSESRCRSQSPSSLSLGSPTGYTRETPFPH